MSRPDLMSLVTRLVDLLTRLFSERVELARGELQEGARSAGRRAVWVIGGGLLSAVGVAFLCAAAVDALAPLVHSRALRLCLVALPLCAAGAAILLRVLKPASAEVESPRRLEAPGQHLSLSTPDLVRKGSDEARSERRD